MWVQAELSKGSKRTTGWIKKKKGVVVGAKVEMKEFNSEFWTVEHLGTTLSNSQKIMMDRFNSPYYE